MVGRYVTGDGGGSVFTGLYWIIARTRMAAGVVVMSATMDGLVGWKSRLGVMS